MAEHLVVVQDVAGSSPVAHPKINWTDYHFSPFLFPILSLILHYVTPLHILGLNS